MLGVLIFSDLDTSDASSKWDSKTPNKEIEDDNY